MSVLSPHSPRRQRKAVYEASTFERRILMTVPLSRELRRRFQRRSVPLRKGDTVRVMSGSFVGREERVAKIDRRGYSVTLDNVTLKTGEAKLKPLAIKTSHLVLTKLNLADAWRRRTLAVKEEDLTPEERGEAPEVARAGPGRGRPDRGDPAPRRSRPRCDDVPPKTATPPREPQAPARRAEGGRPVTFRLKRRAAPRAWTIPRKGTKWIKRPGPGPHAQDQSIPLLLVLRDLRHIVRSAREASLLLRSGVVRVDGKVSKDLDRGLGLMDTALVRRSARRPLPCRQGPARQARPRRDPLDRGGREGGAGPVQAHRPDRQGRGDPARRTQPPPPRHDPLPGRRLREDRGPDPEGHRPPQARPGRARVRRGGLACRPARPASSASRCATPPSPTSSTSPRGSRRSRTTSTSSARRPPRSRSPREWSDERLPRLGPDARARAPPP